MAGPDFHYPRQRHTRRRKPVPPSRRAGSNLWLTPVTAIGFAAALAIVQHFPDGVSIDWRPGAIAANFAGREVAPTNDTLSANFGFCHSGGGSNCVVDGDTFWFAGDKYRIADIDTPETHPARCAEEAALGAAATVRLHEWLNAGAFSLESAGRDSDQYDRKLRVVTRGGTSVGAVLVSDGLARPWEGQRRPWC